ncbi:MAG TPA: hypothetical protein VGC42_20815 [Kofleriaceae bacterium]
MTHRRILASLLALAGTFVLGACGSDASLRVSNQSDFEITDLYLTQVDNPDYGPNLLDDGGLQPDEDITISVDCDTYDVKLIDETGVSCELHAIDLCLNDSDWVITNDTCDAFQNVAKKQAQAKAQATTQAKN